MEKTKEIVIKIINNGYNDDHAVQDLIRYILIDKKTKRRRRCAGGKGVCYLDWKKAAEEFEIIQDVYRKKSKRRIYHMMISFWEEEDELYDVYMFGQRVTEKFFDGHQCVFAVHEDTDNLHIHIAWNAVNYRTGKKWHVSKADIERIKDEITEDWKNRN